MLLMIASITISVLGFAFSEEYKVNSPVTLYVNKIGPYSNPHETYHYYQLPMCHPEKINFKTLSLGEVLDGDRLAESVYDIRFRKDQEEIKLCSPISWDEEQLKTMIEAVEENYYFEFTIDGLSMHGFLGQLEEEGIFPHKHQVFLSTHHHFVFEFNDKHIISAKIELNKKPPIRLDGKPAPFDVTFTYSVEWKQSNVEYKDRDKLNRKYDFFPKSLEIHWLSVINSTLLVFLLMGFVVLILIRVVRNDFVRYNEPVDYDKHLEALDNGWKVIHGDVFRFPKCINLCCAILGVGTQLLSIVIIILVITTLNLLNVHRHGFINVAAMILYAFTSGIAGYVSAYFYKSMGGQRWVLNVNLTSGLFSLPMFLVWCVENSFAWGYHSTQALPATTVLLLLGAWVFVGYPLTIVGGILGKNFARKFDAPCRTRNIPREMPDLPFYHSTFIYCLVGGFLPFSAISVELYYIFSTIWGHDRFTLFGILLIVFAILLSVTACVSVALTYFQLTAEDYHWWWRSIFVGGSTGLFVFAYSVFFYFRRSQLNGLLQTIQYFGYVAMICYAFFLLLGTVAFFASLRFVRYIYANVKND